MRLGSKNKLEPKRKSQESKDNMTWNMKATDEIEEITNIVWSVMRTKYRVVEELKELSVNDN